MIRALIFDFDGTILETEGPVLQSWQELYQSYGSSLTLEEWAVNIGTAEETFDPLDELEKRLGRGLDRDRVAPARRQRELDIIVHQPVLPGVQEYLDDARRLGLKVGLASSSSCAWVTGHLSRLRLLDYFDVINARDDVPRTKPDPILYLATLAGLGVEGKQAVAFEDSPNGVLAAKRAGMQCVAVPNAITRRLPIQGADLWLDSLAELPLEELLRQIEASRADS
jgi:HAD superfamily hydrolase (TIGR01509 family)